MTWQQQILFGLYGITGGPKTRIAHKTLAESTRTFPVGIEHYNNYKRYFDLSYLRANILLDYYYLSRSQKTFCDV